MSQQQKPTVKMTDPEASIYGGTLIEALLPLLQLPNNDQQISERVVHGQHAIIYAMYQKLRAGGYDLHLSVKKDDPAAAQLAAAKQILAAAEAIKKVEGAKKAKLPGNPATKKEIVKGDESVKEADKEVKEASKDDKEPTTTK